MKVSKNSILCVILILFIFIPIQGNGHQLKIKQFFSSQSDKPDYNFTAPRNFTFDGQGNFYIFDYMTNVIRKYSEAGQFILSFGKQGKGEKDFKHLTAIKVYGDNLFALDSIALFKFSLKGKLKGISRFQSEVTCDHPVINPGGGFVGSWISSVDMKRILTFRNSKGENLGDIASYFLTEYYPEVRKGEDFFLNSAGDREYFYVFSSGDSFLWAASDKLRIYRHQNGQSTLFIDVNHVPMAFPEDQAAKLREKKEKMKKNFPALHIHIPRIYNLLYHLFLDSDENIWVYVKSQDFKGFTVYTKQGKSLGKYTLDLDLTADGTVLQVFKDTLYIMVSNRKAMKIHSCKLPVIR